jgi:hypothetical protein
MHEDESDLIKRLQAWQVKPPPADVARCIAAEASRHVQQRSLGQRVGVTLERMLTEWRYGLAVKAGALAVCVIVGFAVGQLHNSSVGAELDVVAIAFGQQDGLEGEL